LLAEAQLLREVIGTCAPQPTIEIRSLCITNTVVVERKYARPAGCPMQHAAQTGTVEQSGNGNFLHGKFRSCQRRNSSLCVPRAERRNSILILPTCARHVRFPPPRP